MDKYLQIAESVLRAARRPLTPRAILEAAYRARIVPSNLYGKTQHKTLGARLSEDIVRRHDRSIFFRPAPGRFFLREYLADNSIPEEYRCPAPTRRRFRDLILGRALAVSREDLDCSIRARVAIDPLRILDMLHTNGVKYKNARRKNHDAVLFRAFVCVQRQGEVLSYRAGRYREDRDAFMNKRCIGFSTLIFESACDLFNREDFGIVSSGVRAAKTDLDIPEVPSEEKNIFAHTLLSHFIWTEDAGTEELLAVISLECPEWFEPIKRRLALNDLAWVHRSAINNLDDYDPWSRQVLMSSPERFFGTKNDSSSAPLY